MAYTSDIYAIMSQIQPVLLQMYFYYFRAEMNTVKLKQSQAELTSQAFESCMSFVKDFELCPYIVNRKLVFYIWYTVQQTKTDMQVLTNDSRNSQIVVKDHG